MFAYNPRSLEQPVPILRLIMTTLSSFQKTDNVDDHLAADYNRFLGGVLRAEFVNTETITATKELDDSDCQFQVITPSGANRTVELAPEAITNHVTIVYNADTTYEIPIKDDSGAIVYDILSPGRWAMFVPVSGEGWVRTAPSGYSLQFLSAQDNPADATTYYFGAWAGTQWTSLANRRYVYVPRSGRIKAVYFSVFISGTLATSEMGTLSVRLNDTTDTIVSSAVTFTANQQVFSKTDLSIVVAAGDTLLLKLVTPTWVTNPTAASISATVWIE